MKFFTFNKIVLSLILLGLVLTKLNLKSQNNEKKSNEKKSNNKKINILGETYTHKVDNPGRFAIADANARVPLDANDEAFDNFTAPQMVNHLAEEVGRPAPGPLEAVSEIPSPNDYYDGSLNLNKVNIKCKIFTVKTDCIQSSGCGWCGSSNSCMFGTSFGPFQPCVKSSWISGTSYPNWIPQIKRVNEPVGGVTASVISRVD